MRRLSNACWTTFEGERYLYICPCRQGSARLALHCKRPRDESTSLPVQAVQTSVLLCVVFYCIGRNSASNSHFALSCSMCADDFLDCTGALCQLFVHPLFRLNCVASPQVREHWPPCAGYCQLLNTVCFGFRTGDTLRLRLIRQSCPDVRKQSNVEIDPLRSRTSQLQVWVFWCCSVTISMYIALTL